MAASLQVVFEGLSVASSIQIQTILLEDAQLARVVVDSVIDSGCMQKNLCSTVLGVAVSSIPRRLPSRKSENNVMNWIIVDSFTVTSSTGNLRGCCIAISKYIGFLRDMTWNTNDRLMILCADSANPINLRGVLTGDSLISCANRRLLCEALNGCDATSILFTAETTNSIWTEYRGVRFRVLCERFYTHKRLTWDRKLLCFGQHGTLTFDRHYWL